LEEGNLAFITIVTLLGLFISLVFEPFHAVFIINEEYFDEIQKIIF